MSGSGTNEKQSSSRCGHDASSSPEEKRRKTSDTTNDSVQRLCPEAKVGRQTIRVLFVYCGSIIYRFEAEVPTGLTLLKWTTTIISGKSLEDCCPVAFKAITEDLQNLSTAQIIPTSDMGHFALVYCEGKAGSFYVYEHRHHASFSRVTFEQIAFIASIDEKVDLVDFSCDRHEHHDALLPYFAGDVAVEKFYWEIKSKNAERATTLMKILKDANPSFPSAMESMESLNENDWTKRLCKGLKKDGFEFEYTAGYGSNHENYWRPRVPSRAIGKKCFVFLGTPDIIVSPPGIVSASHVIHQISTEQGSSDNSDTDSEDSPKSAREMGHQLEPAYKENSLILNKCGELVAAIHLSLVCSALRKIFRGSSFSEIKGYGLLIHKSRSTCLIEVTLGEERMKVNATILSDSLLTSDILCNCLDYFCNKLKT